MANPNNTWKKKQYYGQPPVNDKRWNRDPEAIYHFIHVQRKRAWVLWQAHSSPFGDMPPVGLVVKPLDTYAHVLAFIPWENNNGSADRPLTPYSDLRPKPHVAGQLRVGQGVQYPASLPYATR